MQHFFKNAGTMFLSLLLAVLVWVTAAREQNPPREDDYSHDIPIQVISPAAGLVTVDTIPKTVRLRLLAPESSWTNLTPSKFKASLDLSGFPAGLSDIPVRVEVSDSQIKIVEQEPMLVTVTLQPEQTISLPLKVMVMDAPPLGYISRTPAADPVAVSVTGPASLVGQVHEAVCEVFIRNAKETVIITRPVLVRDREEQALAGLKVTPPKVQVSLPIEQRFGYKDVSVSAVVQGQVAPGYWVSNVSVNPPALAVVGNPQVLSSIPGWIETEPINLSGATTDIVRTVPVRLPDGVTVVLPDKDAGEGTGGVQVKVTIAAIESGQTVRRPVTQQGIDPAYWWQASPDHAEVILSGPIPRLQTLKPAEVKVIVDLFGLKPGVYKVEPDIFLPDGLQFEAVLPQIVEVTVGLNEPVSPIPTPTLAPTPAVTATTATSAAHQAGPILPEEKDN